MNSLPIPRSRKARLGCVAIVFLMLGLCGSGFLVQGVLGKQQPEISLAAEKIPLPFEVPIFGHGVPNTLPATWLTMLVLLIISALATRKMEMIPSGLQNGVEAIIEMFYGFLENVAGEKTRAFFPLVATFFFFILTSNWMGILPGFGSVGVWEEHHGERVLIPFLRSANADLSTTLALALVSVAAAQYFGFKMLGLSYVGRFFRFHRLLTPFARLRGRKRPRGRSELINFLLDFVIDFLSGGGRSGGRPPGIGKRTDKDPILLLPTLRQYLRRRGVAHRHLFPFHLRGFIALHGPGVVRGSHPGLDLHHAHSHLLHDGHHGSRRRGIALDF